MESFASPTTLRHPFSRALWYALPEHGFACGDIEGDGDANSSDTLGGAGRTGGVRAGADPMSAGAQASADPLPAGNAGKEGSTC